MPSALPDTTAAAGPADSAAANRRPPDSAADSTAADSAAVHPPPSIPAFVERASARGYEVSLAGLRGFEIGHLNRVDGWRPGFGLSLLSVRPNALPTLEVSAGMRTHRLEEPWVRATATQILSDLDRLRVWVEGYRDTHTPDGWKIGARENDFWVFLAHSDLRNYYEANGVRLGASTSDLRPWGFELTLLTETNESVQEDGFFTLPTLFGDEGAFRPNPSIAEGRVTSAALEARLVTAASQSPALRVPGWSLTGSLERAGAVLGGDHSFWRGTLHVRRYTRLAERHWLNARLHLSAPVLGTEELPRQRFTYLGGPGSLPGFDTLILGGDRGVLASGEYTFQLPTTPWSAPVFLLWQLEVFSNVGNAVERSARARLYSDLRWDAGLGVSGVTVLGYLGVFLAQRLSNLDEPSSGPRLLFRLQRTF
ncbi:MAG: BamA/TamA family outer membrane protein [Gemmatimonadota bacterium]